MIPHKHGELRQHDREKQSQVDEGMLAVCLNELVGSC